MTDVIDSLAGITPGATAGADRGHRPASRQHAQASYQALLLPAEPGAVSHAERFAIATYVAGLHQAPEVIAHYAEGLRQRDAALAEVVQQAVAATLADGPHGSFPPGPLSLEDSAPPAFELPATVTEALGARLATAFAYAHLLVFHPRDAAAAQFAPLQAAGWSTDALVTLSQLIAFLAFQIRAAAGLRVLATP